MKKNEEPQGSISFRVPDFVSDDGTVFSDIEITICSDGDVRGVVNLTKALERGGEVA